MTDQPTPRAPEAAPMYAGQTGHIYRAVDEALATRAPEPCPDEIDNRDRAEKAADTLAYTIAPESVIGEHSSLNDPWENAVEIAANLRAERDALRAAVERVRALCATDNDRVRWVNGVGCVPILYVRAALDGEPTVG